MFHNRPEINLQHHPLKGEKGLPEDYPTPPVDNNLLFYIQRNHNKNTIVYEANCLHDGRINEEFPMHVFWIRYSDQGEQKELNYIQNKLAYGYVSNVISTQCFEFSLVSYDKKKFYIDKKSCGGYGVYTKINEKNALLTNVYVFAEELGVFPKVKYIEFYGYCTETLLPLYQKIKI